ncbi:MAG: hypothetical protein P1U34_00355 [Coxiellaceae bacterium]|nr:hypothetical protein [Coxiellaceae bacterium]
MKKIYKAAVAVSCMLVGLSAMANVMSSGRQLDGGSIAPNGQKFNLMLSGKILDRVSYDVNCNITNPSADPVMLQVSSVQLYDTNGMYNPQVSVKLNGGYVGNQFALKAGNNAVSFGPVGIRSDQQGYLVLRNLDNTATVTVSNCVATPNS